jgi:formate hydrogenlyase transcriptional activator
MAGTRGVLLNVDSLQRIILTVARSQHVDAVLQNIVRGLADEPDVALARIWLFAPGDICNSCPMRSVCRDRTRCLHLAASAGNPLIDQDSRGGVGGDWGRTDGDFRRIPLNMPADMGHIATLGTPIRVRTEAPQNEESGFSHPEWIKRQGIRSLASHPLAWNGSGIGTLALFSRAELSDIDFDWLRAIANHAAVAISTLRSLGRSTTLDATLSAMAARWRAVFEKSAIGVALTDEHGRFLDVNRAYEKVLGYTEEELRKLSFFDITPVEFRESNRALATDLWAARLEQYQFEKPYRRKDGSLVWVRLHASLVPGAGQGPQFGLALCEDITERKRAEDSLRKSEERWRTLLEINNAIITKLNQDDLFHAICEALKKVVPFGRVALILHDPPKQSLRIAAVEGPFRGENFAVGCQVGPESVSSWVYNQRLPLLRVDLESEWRYPTERLLLDEGIQSLCALPLMVREETSGVLFVASTTKGQYSEHDVSFLQEVANQIALAIENMKAYEEIGALNAKVALTAQHLRTLIEINNAIVTNLSEEALLGAVSQAMRRVVPFDRAALALYLPEKHLFRYLGMESRLTSDYFNSGVEFDPTASVSAWVFDHQQPVVRGDLEGEQIYLNDRRSVAEGVRSDCIVPLILRGKSLGTLHVGSASKYQYSRIDAEFLQEVANQVALAVENMKSYEEIATLKARLEEENIYLQEEIRTEHNFEEIVGNSQPLLEVLRGVEQVAPTDSTVLIFGETGTGKELIARAIHNRSARKDRPLVRVDCSAISAGLVESELFGHMKGAFTGAIERRTGRFELADGGTIFLDEIGELPLEIQAKLLRMLQEHEFEPVGSSRSIRVNVRVIAATNRNLQDAVNSGLYRSDLFYRLNVFPLTVPPLRVRRSDIPQLVAFYLSRSSKKVGKKVDTVSHETMEKLVNYAWPGNVRELQNVIERAVILSPGSALLLNHDLMPDAYSSASAPTESVPDLRPSPSGAETLSTLEEVERRHITAALEQTTGLIEGPRGAARILGLHPNTLRHRMQKLGINRQGHRRR